MALVWYWHPLLSGCGRRSASPSRGAVRPKYVERLGFHDFLEEHLYKHSEAVAFARSARPRAGSA